jgi:hypothetical protein
MKRGYLFAALLFAVFMFPFIGSVSNADALGNYQCGNPDRKTHVNCLRAKLDSTPFGLTVPKGKRGLGKYGCGTKKRRKHVNCLRSLLDQHGAFLAKGATGQVPQIAQPGKNPPESSAAVKEAVSYEAAHKGRTKADDEALCKELENFSELMLGLRGGKAAMATALQSPTLDTMIKLAFTCTSDPFTHRWVRPQEDDMAYEPVQKEALCNALENFSELMLGLRGGKEFAAIAFPPYPGLLKSFVMVYQCREGYANDVFGPSWGR